MNAILVLEDGRAFGGLAFGADRESLGEVVFNTSMTGYQEIISDPSYCGQIVTFTAPHIGNYGVCPLDDQAPRPALAGVVVRSLSPVASSHRARGELDGWLRERGVPGITEVDTRALTRHLRERGAMRGGIWSGPSAERPLEQLVARVQAAPRMEGQDLSGSVTTALARPRPAQGPARQRVAVLDLGVKEGILRCLTQRGLELQVLPATTPATRVLELAPDGVVLSNGPGDPAATQAGIDCARGLLGRLPILGICLGHQVLALALGARTFKLRFGHHGGNHPVKDHDTGEVWITAQNHGFAVDPDTLPGESQLTHTSLYDGTLEGFAVPSSRVLAVQFHPEACPGPSDAGGVFDRYVRLLNGRNRAPA